MSTKRELMFSIILDGIEHVTGGKFGECSIVDALEIIAEFKSILNDRALIDFNEYMLK